MNPERPEKKSDTIKFRVPWSLKRDFLAKARKEGRPASELFRDFMEDYVARPAQHHSLPRLEAVMTTVRKHPKPAFAAILGAAGASALLASAIPAGAAPDLRAAFDMLDADGDGVVTEEEFRQPNGRREFVLRRNTDDDAAPDAEPRPAPLNGRIMLPVAAPDGAAGGGEIRMIVRSQFDPDAEPLPGAPEEIMAREFAASDSDGDKTLTFAEFVAHHDAVREASFATMDANGDGAIDADEAARIGAMGDMAAAALRSMDADGDGRVSRAEYEDAV